MHQTAKMNCQNFFDCYGKYYLPPDQVKVIEIGSQDVNGSLREFVPKNFEYVGVDFVAGKGVDVILDDPYRLPFESESADIVVSSSCFEHSEMFWLLFLEIMRILKPRGLFYLNVPSNGLFHRYPVDCWRFYPDSGNALVTWANRNQMNVTMLESYTSAQFNGLWNDFVAVFLKDKAYVNDFADRITNTFKDFFNGLNVDKGEFLNQRQESEDWRKLMYISRVALNQIRIKV